MLMPKVEKRRETKVCAKFEISVAETGESAIRHQYSVSDLSEIICHRLDELNPPSTSRTAYESSDSPVLSLLWHSLSPSASLSRASPLENDSTAVPGRSERESVLNAWNAN